MKRFIPFIAIIAVVFTSCEYEEYREPYADFNAEYDLVVPGEVISFYNYSEDASYYEWDFGDGNVSNRTNPSHYYSQEGIYTVTLAAYYNNRVDYAYFEVEVYMTTLEIQVREYYSDELIPRMNVVVYPSLYDYDNFGTELYRGVSDYSGSVVVKNLNTQDYYIDVYNDLYNNFTLAAEDLDFIRTLPLEHAKHNIFVAYVDYAPTTYKSTLKSAKVREVTINGEKRSFKDKQDISK